MSNNSQDNEVATLASGCFWCSEAVFSRVRGVKSVLPGYSGGTIENPSYDKKILPMTKYVEGIQDMQNQFR